MESLSVSLLPTPEQRIESHAVIVAQLERYASSSDDEFARIMYTDALGLYEQADPNDHDAYDLDRSIVDHAIRIDDPELITAALPLVYPHDRYQLIAQAATELAAHPKRFKRMTSEHIAQWWDEALAVGQYDVLEHHGSLEAVSSKIIMVASQFVIDLLDRGDAADVPRLYEYANTRITRMVDLARRGQLLWVKENDPSQFEHYLDEQRALAHAAGAAGLWRPAAEFGMEQAAILYRARAGELEDDNIEKLLEIGASKHAQNTQGYYRLLAQTAIATRGRWQQDLDIFTTMVGDLVHDSLVSDTGPRRLAPHLPMALI